MFGDKRQNAIDSIIGSDCHIAGNVTFRGGLRVDGHICGNLQAEPEESGYLMLGPSARVEGGVRAAVIIVAGVVEGNLHASDKLALQPQARIMGDIHYRALAMQAGAVVSGKLCHHPAVEAIPEPVAPTMSGQDLVLKLA
jgi:cytoskeletal protein CcmA (bactofilin family)